MRCTVLITILLILLAPACSSGPQRAEVSGTVKLNGVLIEEGSIQFIPVEGTTGPSTGEAIRNGKYRITKENGVAVGKNRVELRAFVLSKELMQDPTAPQGTLTQVRIPAFPKEYNENSTLVKEVKSGSNTIDFDIITEAPMK